MSQIEIYEKFIEWLGKAWWKMPESEHRLQMISAHYTVEEAEFLTGFPHRLSSLMDIAVSKGVSEVELGPKVSELVKKGLVYESERDGISSFRLADAMFSMMRANMWPQNLKEETRVKEVAPHVNRYYLDNWADQWESGHVKGLRTVPIEKTIKDTRRILPYEDIVKLIDGFEYFTVSNCPCRVRHRMDPDYVDCDYPLEVCLHFDELGHFIVKNDMGREIDKEEAFEILKQAADSGLVHAISTQQEKADTICNCCGCCCLMLEPYHKIGHKESMRKSNYLAEVDASKCSACGLCEKRCPLDAITLKREADARNKWGKTAKIEEAACIGCGVCAHKCPKACISLEQVENPVEPPKTGREWIMELREYQMSRQ